ncbi:multicopper oxidase domain-containing protein [Paenibacillus sp. USDA918EY]|uniref:multicopper oxidase domain-containing protein n=1 Tax=Paenibacillus sp. USDA918EY TaxID=2689575 RepID=UPI0013577705
MPGESHTYRFVVKEAGTHWYHFHQRRSNLYRTWPKGCIPKTVMMAALIHRRNKGTLSSIFFETPRNKRNPVPL